MHPRNPYSTPPDFFELAEIYPALREHLIQTKHGYTIDFHSPIAQRHLNNALLKQDFGLYLNFPEDRLCPAIPNRLNYILWIQDVLDSTSSGSQVSVKGIDIGTGSTAIYPLLACKLLPHWTFVSTEVDPKSRQSAEDNVSQNDLQDCIEVYDASLQGHIFGPLHRPAVTQFDFTMCNPPFYTSTEDIVNSSEGKELAPNGLCTGAEVEMITEGGEAAFVSKMVQESLGLRQSCRWFTSMVGKLSSLNVIVSLIREHGIDNYGITELVQGQTRRWVVAWSFFDHRLPDELGRVTTSNTTLQDLLPAKGIIDQPLQGGESLTQTKNILQEVLQDVHRAQTSAWISSEHTWLTSLEQDQSQISFLVSAIENTWSRSARRRKKAVFFEEPQKSPAEPSSDPRLQVLVSLQSIAESGRTQLRYRWLRGHDFDLFQSFCSHVSRKMIATVPVKA